MVKLIVSDIDGTLMDKRKNIKMSDIEKIRKAKAKGIEICLASGRMYKEITTVMETLGFNCYAICQNGAAVIDNEGKQLALYNYDSNLALSVLESLKHQELVTVVCAFNGNHVMEKSAQTSLIEGRFLSPLIETGDIQSAIKQGFKVTKFSVYGNIPYLEQLLEELNSSLGQKISACFSDPDGIDIMPGSVDKGTGVETLMKRFCLLPHEVACIGDSFNDLSMFRVASHSYAMTTAHDHVKESAKHLTDSVGDAIVHIGSLI